LPREHEQREVPRDDLPGDAVGTGVRAETRVVELVGPAGVIEEPGCDEGNIHVAALLDGLAVVETLGDGELACPLLHQPGDAEEILPAITPAHLGPGLVVSTTGGRDGAIDVLVRG